MTGPIDRAGSGVGCDVGCDVGCGGGTHRRRGAAGDRVMPDVRSRSLSPGSARAVDARERSDDSKNGFWLFWFFGKIFKFFVFGNGFQHVCPYINPKNQFPGNPNYDKARQAVSVFFPEQPVWTAPMISKTWRSPRFFPGLGFWWCPRLGLLHNGRREARLHPVWSGETFRRYTYRAPRTVSRGEVAKGHSARQS